MRAGVVVALVAGAALWARIELPRDFEFRQLRSPAGFRALVLDRGAARRTVSFDPLGGLEDIDRPEGVDAVPDLCEALFHRVDDPQVGPPDAQLTIVEFFDYQCPYCRIVSKFLPEIKAEHEDVRIVYKEWPIFGEASEFAARAALAAHRQGKYDAFHQRLMSSRLIPTEAVISDIADAIGVDDERLLRDRHATEISAAINLNARLARQLGFRGTPSFVIGRTLVEGAIKKDRFRDLIELELRSQDNSPCGADG